MEAATLYIRLVRMRYLPEIKFPPAAGPRCDWGGNSPERALCAIELKALYPRIPDPALARDTAPRHPPPVAESAATATGNGTSPHDIDAKKELTPRDSRRSQTHPNGRRLNRCALVRRTTATGKGPIIGTAGNQDAWWVRDNHWSQGDWIQPQGASPRPSHAPTDDPAQTTQPEVVTWQNISRPSSTELVVSPVGTSHEMRNHSADVQESLHTARTKTRITVQATRSQAPGNFETLTALRKLAIRGAPHTREDRLTRRIMARALYLSPNLYNYIAFGEKDADSPPAPADCPLPIAALRMFATNADGNLPHPHRGVSNVIGGTENHGVWWEMFAGSIETPLGLP